MEIKEYDLVFHKYDFTKKQLLVVVKVFWWLGSKKVKCRDVKDGTFVNDYEHYFQKA